MILNNHSETKKQGIKLRLFSYICTSIVIIITKDVSQLRCGQLHHMNSVSFRIHGLNVIKSYTSCEPNTNILLLSRLGTRNKLVEFAFEIQYVNKKAFFFFFAWFYLFIYLFRMDANKNT